MSLYKMNPKVAKANFALFNLILIIFTLLALYFPYLINLSLDQINFKNISFNIDYLFIGINYIQVLFAFILPLILGKFIFKIKLKNLLKPVSISFRQLFAYFILAVLLTILIPFIFNFIRNYINIKTEFIKPLGILSFNYFNPLYVFSILFLSPLIEELLFRGLMLRFFGKFSNYFAIMICSFIYALMFDNISQAFIAFVLSYLFSKITIRYRSLQPAIFLHVLYNTFFFILQLLLYFELISYMFVLVVIIYLLAIYFYFNNNFKIVKIPYDKSFKLLVKIYFSCYSTYLLIILCLIIPLLKANL